jgi:hypothetical protein
MAAAIFTPAVCEAREGRQDHRPGTVTGSDADVDESTCLDCGRAIVRHYESDYEPDGRQGWSRWTLRAKAVVAS